MSPHRWQGGCWKTSLSLIFTFSCYSLTENGPLRGMASEQLLKALFISIDL